VRPKDAPGCSAGEVAMSGVGKNIEGVAMPGHCTNYRVVPDRRAGVNFRTPEIKINGG